MMRCCRLALSSSTLRDTPPRTFQRCIAIVNTASGNRRARDIFGATFQRLLDHQGVASDLLVVPGPDAQRLVGALSSPSLFRELGDGRSRSVMGATSEVAGVQSEPSDTCIAVCGGDGTINSVVNIIGMLLPETSAALQSKPILLIPAGSTNSICHSLGISSIERSVACLTSSGQESSRRMVQLPLWEVRVNDVPLRYIVSTVATGTYARIVEREGELVEANKEVVGLPTVRKRFRAAVFMECLAANTTGRGGFLPSLFGLGANAHVTKLHLGAAQGRVAGAVTDEVACSSVVASQLNVQRRGYSVTQPTGILTRGATKEPPALSVTWTDAAKSSRLRLLHLFWREGQDREVLQEDGVHMAAGVTEMSFRLPYDAPMLLDGEIVRIPPHHKLSRSNVRSTVTTNDSTREAPSGVERDNAEGDLHSASTCHVTVRAMDPPRFLNVMVA